MKTVTVMVPLGTVPANRQVRKKPGGLLYTTFKELEIRGPTPEDTFRVSASKGCTILINKPGCAESLPDTTQVFVEIDWRTISEFLTDVTEELF